MAGAAAVGAAAARHGRHSGGPARPVRQWPGSAGTPARPVRSAGVQDVAAATSGRGPAAQDTTMVELHDTHDGSSSGGPETELRRIRRTGVYALMDERILRSRVTRL